MSVVDEVKQRVDIVELVSQYVALKRAGRAYTGLCPFHTEKTPSFHVDPSRQSWHCFGACGTGGDVYGFVMRKESCDFREALRMLAQRAGVELDGGRRDTQEDARRARLYEINEAAAAYFNAALEGDGGAGARTYLEERRLADASVRTFQIGYAPNSWDALGKHLESRGFSSQDALRAGLGVEGERGVYDRFRHRLMFPIRDERGRVAGFGGRSLPGEALGAGDVQPKYVNTPQSPIFDKGALLYGLDLAKEAVRREGRAVIVEGYMDAIAAHEHGYDNVVASMGTALTDRQVRLLKRYTRDLVLALDADAAGSEATLRGVRVVADAVDHEATPYVNWRGVIRHQETLAADIRVLTMPAGRDPDDVIRSEPEAWARLVAEAKPVIDYLFEASAAKHDLTSPRERSAAAAELLPLIAALSDRVIQSHYLQRLARMAQVDEETLRLELRRPVKAGTSPREGEGERAVPLRPVVRDRREEFCLGLLFRYPELRAEGQDLDPELFGQSENRALFETWAAWRDVGEPFDQSLGPDLRPHYERVVNLPLPAYDDDAIADALRSTVWGIEQQRLRLAKRASAAMLAEIATQDHDENAQRAYDTWRSSDEVPAEEEADPATAFVEDMEAGLKVHQRILDRQRSAERPVR
ncbi:MAG: DNA primase [Dehalococcoidia bacterium]